MKKKRMKKRKMKEEEVVCSHCGKPISWFTAIRICQRMAMIGEKTKS
jgi:hypothetical protein